MARKCILPVAPIAAGVWIVLLVIVILSVLSGGSYGVDQAFSKSTTLVTQHFTMQNEPKLVVTDSLGTVNIHTGESGSIVVAGTKHAGFFSNLNDIQVNVTPSGSNELDVIVQSSNQGLAFFNNGSAFHLFVAQAIIGGLL